MNARLTAKQTELHNQALDLSRRHREVEAKLVETIAEIDRLKLFRYFGVSSVFKYCVEKLGLSESAAYSFIVVARKSREVPALELAISSQQLSVAKGARLAPVITDENATALIEYSAAHTWRETEQELARLNPRKAKRDSIKALNAELVELKAALPQATLEKLKRAQSIFASKSPNQSQSQSQGADQIASIASVLDAALDEYLWRHDPLKRAERALERKEKREKREKEVKKAENTKNTATKQPHQMQPSYMEQPEAHSETETGQELRAHKNRGPDIGASDFRSSDIRSPEVRSSDIRTQKGNRQKVTVRRPRSAETSIPIPTPSAKPNSSPRFQRIRLTAEQRHSVIKRASGRCEHVDSSGNRCGSDRFLEIHHLRAVHRGGTNELANLALLCSACHDLVHQLSFPLGEGEVSWLRAPHAEYSADRA